MTGGYAYEGSELHLFRGAHNWKRYVRGQLAPFIRGDVLEVGAGLGATTLALHGGNCASWTCLEPDAAMCALLGQQLGALLDATGRAPAIIRGTMADVPSPAMFDTILYIDVLEHIEHDARELAMAALVLRTGGHLIVLSPAHQFLYSAFDRAIGHYRRYDRASLQSCAHHGMNRVRMRYLDSVGVAASLANRALLRQALPTEAQIQTWDRFMVPLSRLLDPLLGYKVGKSIIAVWRCEVDSSRPLHSSN